MGQFVSNRYMKSLKTAINHVKYIAYRERESGRGYGLFSEKNDNVEVKDFIQTLDDKRTSHKDVAKIHTLLFTMSGNEWERGNYQPGDYQTMIRNVMKDWQLEKGITVNWVAAEHDEKGHPHTHVVIKSIFKDSDGIERRLKMTQDDKEWFKKASQEEKSRMVKLRGGREPLPRQMPKREKPQLAKDLLNNLMYSIQRRLREEELKRQMERDRER
jgi:type IV secretory pathway VirD2 relaxase